VHAPLNVKTAASLRGDVLTCFRLVVDTAFFSLCSKNFFFRLTLAYSAALRKKKPPMLSPRPHPLPLSFFSPLIFIFLSITQLREPLKKSERVVAMKKNDKRRMTRIYRFSGGDRSLA